MDSTPQRIAAQDQKDARWRELQKTFILASRVLLMLWFVLGLYSAAAGLGYVPAAPWSPIGEASQ